MGKGDSRVPLTSILSLGGERKCFWAVVVCYMPPYKDFLA
jgi:hypothetical protein